MRKMFMHLLGGAVIPTGEKDDIGEGL